MHDFPHRLHHFAPNWVRAGAQFHIRLRVAHDQGISLLAPELANDLIAAAVRYHELGNWWCELFLLMPDHLHALLVFPRHAEMAKVIRDWKRGTARFQGVKWQDNFFDHRIRNGKEGEEKWRYIRRNPVVKGLCADEDRWAAWWSGALKIDETKKPRNAEPSVLRSSRSTPDKGSAADGGTR